jgi:hypothetical protein
VTRSLALLFAGFWLGLLVASWVAASVSFRTAAELFGPDGRQELADALAATPDAQRRQAMRFMASEVNRGMFARRYVAEIALGVCLFALAWRGQGPWGFAAAALAILVVQAGLHGPILEIGRAIDFLPRPLAPDVASRFGRLHGGYVLLDFAKAGIVAWCAWVLARAR